MEAERRSDPNWGQPQPEASRRRVQQASDYQQPAFALERGAGHLAAAVAPSGSILLMESVDATTCTSADVTRSCRAAVAEGHGPPHGSALHALSAACSPCLARSR